MEISNNVEFVLLMIFTICNAKSYRDHSLIHAIANTDAILEFFMNLERFYNVTFWRKPTQVKKPVEFSISRENLAELRRDTKDMDINFYTIIRDLQSAFDNQTVKPYVRRKMDSFGWDSYHSTEDIYGWLLDLSLMHPKEVHVETIGQTFENRNIILVKVLLDGPKNRSKVMVEGGIHAREWISPAFVTYLINEIVNANYSNDEELKTIANFYEWIFIPVLNPDGYDYSQNKDRLWRKNCRGGYGVDLNRNFGISFGKLGTSGDKQSSEYCGESAFSEKESSALAAYVKDNNENIKYYLAFHSYGQFIVIPYASSQEHRDNFNTVKSLADEASRLSSKRHKISYSIGTAFDTVGYLASGVSADWIKISLNVPYVASFELPDQGEYGFALPTSQILPTCKATMNMLLTFLAPQMEEMKRPRPKDLRRERPMENAVLKNKNYGLIFLILLCSILNIYTYLYISKLE